MQTDIAYKILTADQWAAFQDASVFAGAPIDLTDGYIHLSTDEQLPETLAKHFSGQADLVIAEINLAALGNAVRWEPSRGGALFPHVYGQIPITAVLSVRSDPPFACG
jgi:uncharacterized protein (DUF952 family)